MLIGAEDLVRVDDTIGTHRERRAAHSVRLCVAGLPCAIHFEDGAAAAAFAAKYADLEDSTQNPEREAFVIGDSALGLLLWSRGGAAYRWPHGALPPDAVAFLADAVTMTAFFAERTDGIVSLHAAAVGTASAAAAIVGDSNVGKTTTALACGRVGLRLYSDERCLLDRDARVHPFPRAVNVRDPGRRLLLGDRLAGPDLLGTRLRTHPEAPAWKDVRFAELFGSWTRPEVLPLRIIFLLAGVAAEPRLEDVSTVVAAKAAARWAIGAGAAIDKVARLLDLFAGVRCCRLELGSPDASARAIAEALEAA